MKLKLWKKQSAPNASKKIFFLHVPKCGGTSCRTAIGNAFDLPIGSSDESFHLDAAATVSAAETLEKPIIQLNRELLNYCMAHKSYRYISGHFAYSEKAMQTYGANWQYITLLRDPVAKWFSQYFYNRHKNSGHYRLNCDLETFLETDNAIKLGSNYIHLLADGVSSEEAATDEAINRAIENLNKFALVGLLEHLDWFCQDFQTIFGTELKLKKLNKNPLPETQRKQQITDDIRSRVWEICQPNMRLYEAATKIVAARREQAA